MAGVLGLAGGGGGGGLCDENKRGVKPILQFHILNLNLNLNFKLKLVVVVAAGCVTRKNAVFNQSSNSIS